MPRLETGNLYRDRVRPHWFADGTKFWYRVETGKDAHEYVLVNVVQGRRELAFDHARLADALEAVGTTELSASRLPLENLDFEAKEASFCFSLGARAWRCALESYALTPIPTRAVVNGAVSRMATRARASRRTGTDTSLTFVNRSGRPVEVFWLDTEGGKRSYGRVNAGETKEQHTFAGHVWSVVGEGGRELMAIEAAEEGATVEVTGEVVRPEVVRRTDRREGRSFAEATSPDREWRAVIRDHRIYVQEVSTGKETVLSQDGNAEDGYGGRVYWSPDSKKLVALRTVAGDTRKVTVVESSPKGEVQPRVISFDYLKPGDRIPVTKPHLFSVETLSEIPVKDALFANPWSVSDLRWAADSGRFTFLYNQRGHQVLRVVAVHVGDGKATAVVNETSETFIDYSGKYFCEYLDETGELLWMSERDGWNHLYLYDAQTGRVRSQVTKGEWVVRGVDYVDRTNRQVWFRAGGIRPGQDPYYVHHARVNLDGSGLVVFTEGNGSHSVQYSPDREYVIDSWSRVDQPPAIELRRTRDGALVCGLETADAAELRKRGWRSPERFVAKGRDGQTDIYGIVHFPRSFDPAGKYPVIESIYAGPQAAFVPKTFAKSYPSDGLTACGFIVVQIDGMGTSLRSKKFHDLCWKNLGDSGFPDRVRWIRAAAEKYRAIDLEHVGIYGTSAGGQSALRGLLAHGDFYKAGVADSGCHDNRMDKIWWNELWMGWPVGPHYAEQSNVTQAHRLTGQLLLMAGELDRNVDPASTMQVVDALIKANRKFELMIVPGAGHGVLGSAYGQARLREFFMRTLGPPR